MNIGRNGLRRHRQDGAAIEVRHRSDVDRESIEDDAVVPAIVIDVIIGIIDRDVGRRRDRYRTWRREPGSHDALAGATLRVRLAGCRCGGDADQKQGGGYKNAGPSLPRAQF